MKSAGAPFPRGRIHDRSTGELAMFVVAGVTGKTGAVVARALLAAKKPVRVLVRDERKGAAWRDEGAEVRVVTTLDDEAALTSALERAEGAYLLSPPDLHTE